MGNNLKKCPKCGSEIANVATECPICNYNFLKPVNNNVVNNTNVPKKKHGCLITVLVIVGVIFLVSLFGGSDDEKDKKGKEAVKNASTSTQTEKTSSPKKNSKKAKQKPLKYNFGNICKKNKCKFKLVKGDKKGISIQVDNKSKKDYSFSVHSMSVNGKMTNCNIYTASTSVPSNKKGIMDIEFEDEWMEGIDNVEYVDLLIWAYDDAKSMKDFETGIIRVKTNYFNGEKKFKPAKGAKKDKGLIIEKVKLDTDIFVFSVINKNSKYIEFDFDNSSINGWAFEDDYLFDVKGVYVYPDSKTTVSIDLSDFTEKNKIKKIKNIEFSLKVRTEGDYFKEKETKKVKFK